MKNQNHTPLIDATIKGNYELVKNLLKSGANVDEQGEFDETALMHAAQQNDTKMIELLLHAGANIEAQNYIGFTPLMRAIYDQKENAVRLLVDRGAAINIEGEDAQTPLILATPPSKKNIEIMRILLESGTDINATNSDGCTALMYAIGFGRDEIVELMLKAGAIVNKGDLTRAAAGNHVKIADLLLQHGAEINEKYFDGKTALEYAIEFKHDAMIELLKRYGAN